MTDISVVSTSYQVPKRSWLIGKHGTDETISGTLDVSALTAATHYPNGYVPSGLVLGIITASGLYAPYNDSLANGQEVAAGILFGDVRIPNLSDLTKDVGIAVLVHGFVKISKMPVLAAGTPTGRGYYDAAAAVDLKLIHFVA
jgi:hypothetical protein